jgi:hypothetical protein
MNLRDSFPPLAGKNGHRVLYAALPHHNIRIFETLPVLQLVRRLTSDRATVLQQGLSPGLSMIGAMGSWNAGSFGPVFAATCRMLS